MSDQQAMFSYFLGSRASVHVAVHLEDECLNNESPTTSFLLAFVAKRGVIGQGRSLWSVWVNCPGYIPSQPLAHPKLTGLWGDNSLDAVPALLSSSQNTGVLSIRF